MRQTRNILSIKSETKHSRLFHCYTFKRARVGYAHWAGPPLSKWRTSVRYRRAAHALPYRRPGRKKTYRCTPPSTLDTFGEKSRALSASVNEIAGLLKKKKKMKNMMTRNREKACDQFLARPTGSR